MRVGRVLVLAAFGTGSAWAQSPDAALSARWDAVCAGAVPAGPLAARCAEIFAGGPGSRDIAAAGNFLGEIPGQGRAATRDGAPEDGDLRTELGAGWSLFASADTGRLKRRDGVNEAPFDGDTGAISAGVDWAPGTDWRLGLLLNHARDELDFTLSDGSLRTRFTGLMALGGWNLGEQWSLDGYAGRLDGDYRIQRRINYRFVAGGGVDAAASARPDAERDLAGLGLTWARSQGAWEWQLGAGLDWQRTSIEPYRETGGAGLALTVPGRAIVSRRGRLDASLGRTLSTGWGVLQPLARVGWRHEYANPARPLTVRFVEDLNGTPVVFETDDADTGWGEASLGAVFVFTGGHSAFVEYRQRFGQDFLQERILSVGWRFELP
ncbi:autotransporter outer membrane beta-barrel domain-containing protein [Arenimonas sp. MALMAid1274]|uniref:autotransporter outer membrane beta-barrel domain-containing protein n=1 Tax=Arenimonas sp. MALMAid1274 TaxID=3411630 RepID=UPI003B9FDB75